VGDGCIQTSELSGRIMKFPVSGLPPHPPSSAATIDRAFAPFTLSQYA
jgi:hypothetical protein